MMHCIVQVCLCVVFGSTALADPWNYQNLGPDIWSEYYPSCAGQSQSPINILTACTTYRDLPAFSFARAYDEPLDFTVQRFGHTIVGTLLGHHPLSVVQLTGGGLDGTFEFVNFHLHWGENYRTGSEHHVNGMKYAGEIHFVHRNPVTAQYAVLGIFMHSYPATHRLHGHQTNEIAHEDWQKYFDLAQKLEVDNASVISDVRLSSLMGEYLQDFWRYEGSLTTPPCTEGIIWTVFKQSIVFREEQLQQLRDHIHFEAYRSPQPLYNRAVYRNFHNEIRSRVPDYQRCPGESPAEIDVSQSWTTTMTECSSSPVFLCLFLLSSASIVTVVILLKFDYLTWKRKHQ